MTTFIHALNDDMAAVAQRVRGTLVQITGGRGPRSGAGSGTIWSADGVIITNAHVVMNRRRLQVTLADGRTLPGTLIAADPEHDVAAIKVAATDLPAIEAGDSQALRPGALVFAVGHPWGVLGAVSAGVLIAQGGDLQEWPAAGRDFLAVNLRVRPGNSGGPLVDAEGRLLGLNTIMNGPEVGLAVPVHVIERFMAQVAPARAETDRPRPAHERGHGAEPHYL